MRLAPDGSRYSAQLAAGAGGPPVTTDRGDIIRRGPSGDERLPVGPADTFLRSDGTDVEYGNLGGGLVDSYLDIADVAAPANPPADTFRFYAKNDGLYYRNSAGVETGPLGSGGGGGGGGGGYEDLASLKPYTLAPAPDGAFPEKNIVVNGTSQVGVLTMPGWLEAAPAGSTGITAGRAIGWKRVNLTAGVGTVRIDLGSPLTIGAGRIMGWWNTSNQVTHPAAVDLYYSDDDAAWTIFGAAVSGMGNNPGALGNAHWVVEIADTPASHRYWRVRVTGGTLSGDDWLMLNRVHLLGRASDRPQVLHTVDNFAVDGP